MNLTRHYLVPTQLLANNQIRFWCPVCHTSFVLTPNSAVKVGLWDERNKVVHFLDRNNSKLPQSVVIETTTSASDSLLEAFAESHEEKLKQLKEE